MPYVFKYRNGLLLCVCFLVFSRHRSAREHITYPTSTDLSWLRLPVAFGIDLHSALRVPVQWTPRFSLYSSRCPPGCFGSAVWRPPFGGSSTGEPRTETRSWSSCRFARPKTSCSMWWARTEPSSRWTMSARPSGCCGSFRKKSPNCCGLWRSSGATRSSWPSGFWRRTKLLLWMIACWSTRCTVSSGMSPGRHTCRGSVLMSCHAKF